MSETEPGLVRVLAPVAVDEAYTYRVPHGMRLAPGDLVRVELGSREFVGVVWDDPPSTVEPARLKTVLGRAEGPAIRAELRRFVDWVAHYTLSQRGMVLRMVLRSGTGPERARTGVRLAGPPPERMTAARARVLEVAGTGAVLTKAELAEAAGVSAAVVDGLLEAGTLVTVELPPEPVAERPDPDRARPALNASQAQAAERLAAAVARTFSATLLDGVTGAGKTEVYFEAVAEALRQGRQALVLLPEIALTAQFLDRFAARFGARPAEWHSALTPRRRERTWKAVSEGEAQVVVGARSALFLPFRDLGLIVVDEEHDPAYKQEDRIIYNARDMAVVRARLNDIPVILSSATPSLETRHNAETGRYGLVELPERFAGRLPRTEAIDMRVEGPPRGRWIAPRLEEAVRDALARNEQALLFLNRRGYAPLTLCRACGYRFGCPQCSAWLVEHRFKRVLACHHCGYAVPRPMACPNCDSPDSLVPCGPGVERVAEEVAALFPEARRVVLSSDLLGGVERLREELDSIAKGDMDIVVGTQLVAKGHNFPRMTLVGVIDADIGLAQGDPRAAERTFHLLSQVTGRAGRAAPESRGLVQTYAPELPLMQALVAGDRDAFYAAEAEERRLGGLPPFGRLAALIVTAETQPAAESYARALARAAPRSDSIKVLGPAEAPIAVLRGRHRWRLLVKAPRSADLQHYLRDWLDTAPPQRGGVRVFVDVDPQSFL